MPELPKNYRPLLPEVKTFLGRTLQPFIGGAYRDVLSGETFTTYDPSSARPLARIGRAREADVDSAVVAARSAFAGDWRNAMTPSERTKCLWRFAELIEQHADALAQLDALDNGKPFETVKTVDVPLAAEHLYYYAGWCSKVEGNTIPTNTRGMLNYTVREPIGVVGLIVPWNYPLLMAAWKFAPALAAGNCVILKPAEQTPLSALYIAQLSGEAGFPPGVFNVVPGFGEEAGAALVAHPGVGKIGFTGSADVARSIVKNSLGNLKRVSLELGGKSPNIIFADADLERAAVGSTWAIFGNNGQSCTAGSRLYIARSIFDEVVARMAEEAAKIVVGPGMSKNLAPQLGPIISEAQLEVVSSFISEGLQQGGNAVAGGERMQQDGYFLQPTIFSDVDETSRLVRDEIFGPVVCALPFDEEDDVLRRANDTPYGLAAGLWTKDLSRALRVSSALQAGTVWVNTWGDTEAGSPFGGYKESGHGREMGKEALELYSEVKSIWIRYG